MCIRDRTNTNTGAAGVLGLTNNGTNSAVSILQSGTSEPSAGQALLLANNNTTTPTGNLIDLQNKGGSKFSVDINGAVTAASTYNTNTFTSSALTFGAAGTATIQPASGQALKLNSGTTGTITLDSGTTGNVNIGTGANAKTIQIGNTTGAVAQIIHIGNNATASSTSTVVLGSTIGTSPVTIQSGTGGVGVTAAAGANTATAGNLSLIHILNRIIEVYL